MTEALAGLAEQGLGVAWLPDSSFGPGRLGGLVPAGDASWNVEVSIRAYRAKANLRPALDRCGSGSAPMSTAMRGRIVE